jgi:hypothetical protein
VDMERQVRSNRLWLAVLGLDIQLYKASIYRQRWGSPGGIDQALPCYDEAARILDGTDWPQELRADADDLARRVSAFRETLVAKDVTTASAGHTRMLLSFEELREGVRHWPNPKPAVRRGIEPTRETVAAHTGMEAPGS